MSRKNCPSCGQPVDAALRALAQHLREEVARLEQDARRFHDRGFAVFAGDVRALRGRLVNLLLLVDQSSAREAR